MSRLQPCNHQTSLLSTSGTWGEADIVASSRGVLIDVRSTTYDTMGHPHRGVALLDLTVPEARHLSRLLDSAIAAAADAIPHQPGLWSEATVAQIARRVAA
jgi:hypothetical protein